MDRQVSGTNLGSTAEFIPRFQLDYRSFRSLHTLVRNRPVSRIGLSRFASRLMLYFPEVAVNIDEDDFGILHLEIGELKLATRKAIAGSEWYTVRKHFNFIGDLFENAGNELRDAISVSYLGALLYGENSENFSTARRMLPEALATALENVERHYDRMAL